MRGQFVDVEAGDGYAVAQGVGAGEQAWLGPSLLRRRGKQPDKQPADYLYIISNIGSFGEEVYKVGMTRRLDPMDRVYELGDASVPFPFDVHAMIYSEDAPRLEALLHRFFDSRRVNLANTKKEFFRVKLDDIRGVVEKNHAGEVKFTLLAEAAEYRRSETLRNSNRAESSF